MESLLSGVSIDEMEEAARAVQAKPTEELVKAYGPNEVSFEDVFSD